MMFLLSLVYLAIVLSGLFVYFKLIVPQVLEDHNGYEQILREQETPSRTYERSQTTSDQKRRLGPNARKVSRNIRMQEDGIYLGKTSISQRDLMEAMNDLAERNHVTVDIYVAKEVSMSELNDLTKDLKALGVDFKLDLE